MPPVIVAEPEEPLLPTTNCGNTNPAGIENVPESVLPLPKSSVNDPPKALETVRPEVFTMPEAEKFAVPRFVSNAVPAPLKL